MIRFTLWNVVDVFLPFSALYLISYLHRRTLYHPFLWIKQIRSGSLTRKNIDFQREKMYFLIIYYNKQEYPFLLF